MTYRVIQWATGDVGTNALRHILAHPHLELVGVHVYSEQKAGRDVGEILGGDPIGIVATTDIEELLALDADAVCHTARAEPGTPGVGSADGVPTVVDEIARILASGKNVVTTSLMSLVYPEVMGPEVMKRLETGCALGDSSFHASGLNPGFAADMWPMVMTGLCQSVQSIEVLEDCYMGDKDNHDVLVGYLGFGRPPAECHDHINLTTWRAPIELLAASLGWRIDDIELRYRRTVSKEDVTLPTGLFIAKGTTDCYRRDVVARVGGQGRLFWSNIERATRTAAPHWPHRPGWTLTIEGAPRIVSHIEMTNPYRDEREITMATAAHAVNAIPMVCRAPTGVRTLLDLPIIGGQFR
jgi:hypothetical protein